MYQHRSRVDEQLAALTRSRDLINYYKVGIYEDVLDARRDTSA